MGLDRGTRKQEDCRWFGSRPPKKAEKDLGEGKRELVPRISSAMRAHKAAQIIDQAGKRSNEMIEEAKGTASSEAQRLVAQAHEEAARESTRAREGLRQEVGQACGRGRLAPCSDARSIPRATPRAPRRAGSRGLAWLSGPPSPGPTRKRRFEYARDARAFAEWSRGPADSRQR